MEKLLLIVDIGNSYCKVGIGSYKKIEKKILFKTSSALTLKYIINKIKKSFGKYQIQGSIIGSVVAKLTTRFYKSILHIFKINSYLINNTTKFSFSTKEICKSEVGQDIFALSEYCVNKAENAIGFSFGTALFGTFIKNKSLAGVSITVGLGKSVDTLVDNISMIQKDTVSVSSHSSFGTNTKTALESGINHVRSGFVKGFHDAALEVIKSKKIYCILTGGEAFEIAEPNFDYQIDFDAILIGYALIFKLNN